MSNKPPIRHLFVTFLAFALLAPAVALAQDLPAEAPVEEGGEAGDSDPAEDDAAPAPPAPSVPPAPVTADSTLPSEAPPEGAEPEEEEPPIVSAQLGKGLTVRSDDGRFTMTLRGRAQLRFTGQTDSPGNDDASLGFAARRVRLLLQGQLLGPELQYYLQLGFSNGDTESDLRLPLRDAYMTSSHIRDLNVRVGQMKVPHDRQRVVSSSALQFPDRSIVTAEFNLDRDVGMQVFSTDLGGWGGRLGYNVGIFGGDGRNRLASDTGLLYVGRVQILPFGPFDDFVEADLSRSSDPHLAIAFSGAFNHHSPRRRSTFDQTFTLGEYNYVHFTSDFLLKWAGLSLTGQFFYRNVIGTRERTGVDDDGNPVTETSRSGLGYFVQGGFMLTDHLEIVARWGEIRPFQVLRTVVTAISENGELGGGLGWYIRDHNLKIQADYFWLYEGSLDAGRHQIRVQTQFYL